MLRSSSLGGKVQFEHVSFAYEEEEKPVIHDINLDVEKGKSVAFVGMSGGGKSTLICSLAKQSEFFFMVF